MKHVITFTLLATIFYTTQTMEKEEEKKKKQPQQQQVIYPFHSESEIQTPEYQQVKNGINHLLQTEEGTNALEYIKLKYLNPSRQLPIPIHTSLEQCGLLVDGKIPKEIYSAVEEYRSTTAYFKQVKKSQKALFNNHLNTLTAEKQAKVLEGTKQMLAFKKRLDEEKKKSKDP